MSRIGLATGESVGQWQATGPAPSIGSVQRVRVADPTGLPAEALIVGSEVSLEARSAFARRHRSILGVRSSNLVRTLEVIEEPTRVIVIREPTEDQTLAAASLPLPSDVVAAIGAHLATAVQDGATALPGALVAHDIALGADGRPLFAPLGLEQPAVARSALGHVAPEAFQGATPDADSALYGLGAVLYLLTTGQSPLGRADGNSRPPVPASALRHGVPPNHDRALQALLSATPAARRAALPLLQEAAGTIPDLRPSVTTSRVGEVLYTTSSTGPRAARNLSSHGALVLIEPEAWSGLTPGAQALAAGLAGVGMRFADAQLAGGAPLVLDTAAGAAAAKSRSEDLQRLHDLPTVAVAGGGVPFLIPFLLGAGIAAGIALLGLLFVAVAWWPVALVTFVFAMLVLAAGAVTGRWAGAGRRATKRASSALDAQQAHQRSRNPDGRLDAAWDRVARLRVQLAADHTLPEPAQADLRSALKETEDRLESIADAVQASGRSLKQVDAAGLRTRLNALNQRVGHEPRLLAERDRLAATVADLDAVDEQRRRILEDVRHVDSDLDNIAAALGRVGTDDPGGLSNLAKTVSADERRRRAQAARKGREPS